MLALIDARKLLLLGFVVAAIYAYFLYVGERAVNTQAPAARTTLSVGGHVADPPELAIESQSQNQNGALRLTGRLVDTQQRSIGGATITLDGTRTTTSEADGSFAFKELAPGSYQLTAEHGAAYGETAVLLDDGSDPAVIMLRVGPTLVIHVVDRTSAPVLGVKVRPLRGLDALTDRLGTVTFRGLSFGTACVDIVALGYASEHLAIDVGDDPRLTIHKKVVLQPGAPIGGIVVDQDGAPVADAWVEVASSRGSDHVGADDHGRWKLEGLGAGKLRLTASSDANRAVPDLVVPFDGTTPQLDLVIHTARGATIGGVAVDAAGKPLADVTVYASETDLDTGWASNRGVTDERGRFQVAGFAAGKAKIEAWTDTLGTPTQTVEVPRRGHVEVRLVMVESGISGVVTNLAGDPVANARVTADGPGYASDYSDASGHFDLKGVPPGDYRVIVKRDSAVDVELGLADAHAVAVHSGDHHVSLVLPDAASITGRVVLNGRPVEYFGVAVAKGPTAFPEPRVASDGRFVLGDLQPASEWPELRSIVLVGPSFQRKVIEDVLVTTGRPTDLGDIEVTAGKTVRGRVVDASGTPISGATVVVQSGDLLETEVSLRKQNDGSRGTRSDASGHFEIAGLPDDIADLQIQAQNPEHGLGLPRPLTAADLDRDIQIVLAATGSVAGSVIEDNLKATHVIRLMSLADGRERIEFTSQGEFSITQLPPGDYRAWFDSTVLAMPPVTFHIEANQTTALSFTPPSTLITVNATTGGPCTGVMIASPDVDVSSSRAVDWVRWFECADATHAVLDNVAPGRYQMCNYRSDCTIVDIAPSPERQSVILSGPPQNLQPSEEDPSSSPEAPSPEPTEIGSEPQRRGSDPRAKCRVEMERQKTKA